MIFLYLKPKHFSRIPKKEKVVLLLLLFVLMLFFVNLFFTPARKLNNLQQTEIHIFNAYRNDKFSHGDSSASYTIKANECSYYLNVPYRSAEHDKFIADIEGDLLGGRINSASVVVTTKQTILDKIRNRYDILSLSIDGIEYLSIETSRRTLVWEYIGAWFFFLLLTVLFIGYAFLLVVGYDVIGYGNKKDKKPFRANHKKKQ